MTMVLAESHAVMKSCFAFHAIRAVVTCAASEVSDGTVASYEKPGAPAG